MSYNSIIRIADEPVDRDDWATEMDYYENMPPVADYVEKLGAEGIEKFLETLNGNGLKYNPETGELTISKTERLTQERADSFWSAVEDIYNASKTKSKEQLLAMYQDTDMANVLYSLKKTYVNEFDIYIDDGSNLCPIDEYVRYIDGDEKTVYIGGVVDYHY